MKIYVIKIVIFTHPECPAATGALAAAGLAVADCCEAEGVSAVEEEEDAGTSTSRQSSPSATISAIRVPTFTSLTSLPTFKIE